MANSRLVIVRIGDGTLLLIIQSVKPVGTPFVHIAAHVVQAQCIGAVEASDRYGFAAAQAYNGIIVLHSGRVLGNGSQPAG